MKKVAIIISPNYKDYGKKYLPDFMESLRKQDYLGEKKIYITDNETSEESYGFLRELAPEVHIIRKELNSGFAEGNNDAMKLALEEKCEYIILLNIDATLDKSCVSEMVKTAESDENIGAVQATMLLHQEKNIINSIGNTNHFLGFGYCLGYRQNINSVELKVQDILYPSGAASLFKREVLEKVGLYDEVYWMYNEDQELGWKTWLAGYRCVLSPKALFYHKYEFSKSIKNYYWMDRNRIISILKCYKIPTLILIFPVFIIMELGLMLFALKTGWWKDKLKVWFFFLKPSTWKYLRVERKKVQALRVVSDRKINKMIKGTIWYQEVDDVKLRLVNPIFNLYWKIVKLITIW